jgi:methylphosphotriester-DNA--protein-cysteine methyltransferase
MAVCRCRSVYRNGVPYIWINEISAISFRDASNFNHAFKRRFGLSPREYRERRQGDPADDSFPE